MTNYAFSHSDDYMYAFAVATSSDKDLVECLGTNLCSQLVKAVDKRQHYVGVASLSIFGGNFVLAKVRWGLISVRCSELRGVRFSEVRNVLVLW